MPNAHSNYIIEMLGITKKFPGIIANNDVTLQIEGGSVHALLGENGSGKSTLMNVLFGLLVPDAGSIRLRGSDVAITDPHVATELGIGMVHQHFQLIDTFTVTENIILGIEDKKSFNRIDIKKAADRIAEISEKCGLTVDPYALVRDIPVSMQQRVEILKMLYRDAEIMIFDEPTAVLVPSEIEELMQIMRKLVSEGKTILLITHKLKEIKAVASRCSVLRRGKMIDTVDVENCDEAELARMMVGRPVDFSVHKADTEKNETILSVRDLTVRDDQHHVQVNRVSFDVQAGEILSIAGVEGNGQLALVDALLGVRKISSGSIHLSGTGMERLSIRERTELGLGIIPEDRQKHGLILDFTLAENLALKQYYQQPYSRWGTLQFDHFQKHAELLIDEFDIRSGQGSSTIVRSMSGGNQQKAIVAREIDMSPPLLIVVQPTRGLDVGAIEYIHSRIVQERDNGRAILLVSMELDEVILLSDRIAVMYNGEIVDVVEGNEIDTVQLGLMMIGQSGRVHKGRKDE